MHERNPSRYGGVAGKVLRESLTPGAFLTGLAVALPVGMIAVLAGRSRSDLSPALAAQLIAVLALARIARNGYAGEYRGSVFSRAGGSDFDVLAVVFRFLLLSACWLIPLHLLGFRAGDTASSAGMLMMGMGGGEKAVLGALYVTLVALSPPIFLIASVGATNVADLFSPAYWRDTFGGRFADLFLVYSLYLGGVAMAVLLALPLLVIAASQGGKSALFFGAVAGIYLAGFALNLLGRLCGFFAAAGGGPEEGERAPLDPEPILDALVRADRPARGKKALPPIHRITTGKGGGAAAGPADSAGVVSARGRPVVTDAAGRVRKAEARFAADPDGAIGELRRLDEECEPNPLVLCGLCRLLLAAGREEEAVERAQRAIPWSLDRGSPKPAAETYREFGARAARLDLDGAVLLRLGHALRGMRDLEGAERAYRAALDRDPEESGAVKGLLQTAEAHLRRKGAPRDAIRIYDHLLERCPQSPLADFMREGKEEAELRLARR